MILSNLPSTKNHRYRGGFSVLHLSATVHRLTCYPITKGFQR